MKKDKSLFIVLGIAVIVIILLVLIFVGKENVLLRDKSGDWIGGGGFVSKQVLITNTAFTYSGTPYTIEEAKIVGKELIVTFVTKGGCKEHDFSAYSPVLEREGFMESNPVQANVYFTHNNNGDTCESIIEKNYKYDITPIIERYKQFYGREDSIMLNLVYDLTGNNGNPSVIRVTYSP